MAAAPLAAQPTVDMEKGFAQPPDSAKPHVWWHWMNGNITKEGITADLEAMKSIGVGGAQIFNVGPMGIPAGPVKFLSPEWRELFKHAVSEANRLCLELCVHNGAGWSSSGGPWITPENAMQQVVTSEVLVRGPARFDKVLQSPQSKLDYYRDIAVLAFRRPASELASVSKASPQASASIPGDASVVLDGRPETALTLPAPSQNKPQFVTLEFAEPASVRSIRLITKEGMRYCAGVVQVSEDGAKFRNIRSFEFGRSNGKQIIVLLGKLPVVSRFWRVAFLRPPKSSQRIVLSGIELSSKLAIENLDAKICSNTDSIDPEPVLPAQPGEVILQNEIVDLTAKLTPEGRLAWDVPAGDWVILRVGHTPTGEPNHPAPEGGVGLECDKLSKAAFDAHWAGCMQKIIDDAGPLAGKALNNVLIDSYEVGGQNWTDKFREEFRARRGYDLEPFFPVFTGRVVESPEVTERFLADLRRTIADLFAENYFGRFAERCHQNKLLASLEPYNGPFESIQCGKSADIVMGEFWTGSQGHLSVKTASSAAHIYGKTLVGAESFTTGLDSARWQSDPYSLKLLGDAMYCQGINRFIFHRYAMQPWTNRWPGMTMGPWGLNFERTLTWWEQASAWMQYTARCQFMLQQGSFVADAATFCGENALHLLKLDPGLPSGYDYDGLTTDVLLHHASVKDGRLALDSGMSYRALVLNQLERTMTPLLLRKLREFVADGLTLVGPPPEKSQGLTGYPQCDAEVKSLVAEIWGNCDGKSVTQHPFGKGRVVWGQTMAQVFAGLEVKPDFEFPECKSKLAFIHRMDGDADIYFVSNQRDQFDSLDCTFRVSGKVPELWHPDTGRIEQAPVWREENGRTIVPLPFDPAGSVFVVFRKKAGAGDHIASAKYVTAHELAITNEPPAFQLVANTDDTLEFRASTPAVAELTTASGKMLKLEVRDVPKPVEVVGPWELKFPPNWGAPAQVSLAQLSSWTENSESGVKYFSGTATYVKELEIPAGMFTGGNLLWLNLGEVKNIAEVFVNGKPLGILWKPPFRANITGAARPGKNKLEIKVTNLWPNRLIGEEQLPPDCEWSRDMTLKEWPQWLLEGKPSPTGRITFSTYHLWKKDDKPLPSGLLGPVTITAQAKVSEPH